MASVSEWAYKRWVDGTASTPSDWKTTSQNLLQVGYTASNAVVCFRFKLDCYASQFNLKLCNHESSVNSGTVNSRRLRYKVLATDDENYHDTTSSTAYNGTITTPTQVYTAVTTTITASDCGFTAFNKDTYYYIFLFAQDYSSGSNYQNLRAYPVTSDYGTGIPASSIVETTVGMVRIDNGSSFDSYTVWIDNGSSFEQYVPYIDNGTAWELYGG